MKKIYISFCLMLISAIAFPQWSQQTSGTTRYLNSVFFINSANGYIVGDYGTILKTTNGGINWTIKSSGTNSDLSSVFFTDINTGYIATGSSVLKTTNGGNNWISQTGGNIESVFFTDANTGYSAGTFGIVFKTTNAGTNWVQIFGPTFYLSNFYSQYFTSTTTGFVVGYDVDNWRGVIYRTTNGGNNFSYTSYANCVCFNSVFFPSSTNGYAVGESGCIYKTINGGGSWVQQNSGTTELLNSVFFTNINTGYVTGGSGKIFCSTNAGSNWFMHSTPVTQVLNSVYFADSNNGWAVGGYGTILYTNNGGGISIDEIYLPETAFSLFPNPATNLLNIVYNSDFQKETYISIFNIRGEQVFSSTFNNQNSMDIDVSSFAKGVYMVKIQTEQGFAVKKLVVQ